MLKFNKILVITLLAVLANAIQAEEITSVEQHIVETKPAQSAILTQLKSQASASVDAVYTYKCTVGAFVSSRIACSAGDNMSWSTPHNVDVRLRCPGSGSNLFISYVEVNFSVTSQNVNCFVNEGGVGYSYIGITVQAWNTLLLQYSSTFYSY